MTIVRYVGRQASSETGEVEGVHCVWHDSIGEPHSAVYPPEVLCSDDGEAVPRLNRRQAGGI